jgi:HK97 family phage portal protein
MILKTPQGDRDFFSFALTDMVRWGYNGLRSTQSTSVGERDMRGIPAIARAARMRAEAVASLRLYVWRGEGPSTQRVDTAWQAKLFRSPQPNPQQTRFEFWEAVEEWQAYRNASYIWKNVDGGQVVEWYALHPDQVDPKIDGTYEVKVAPGFVDPTGQGPATYKVDCSTILHVRGHGLGGQLIAPTPISQFRDAMAGPVGRQLHEGRMWRRGVAGQVAIVFPAGIGKEQADQWRETYRANYEGPTGETTLVLGGGAEIKPMGLTPADAQFVQMAQLTVMDAARIMGIPANLLGVPVQEKGTPDLEQDLLTWLRFGIGPSLERIEAALLADESLFGQRARLGAAVSGSLGIYPKFFTDGFVRGDNATEASILQTDVQSGILLPDEARAMKGLGPLPGAPDEQGRTPGQIPQITPVGGAPNAKPTVVDQPDVSAPASTARVQVPSIELVASIDTQPIADALAEAHRQAERLARQRGEELAEAVNALHDRPVVLSVPEQEAPTVVVNVPEQAAPVVNVSVPKQTSPDVHVHVPEQGDAEVERNAQGFITRIKRSRRD